MSKTALVIAAAITWLAMLVAAYVWLMDSKAADSDRYQRAWIFRRVVTGDLAEHAQLTKSNDLIKRDFWAYEPITNAPIACNLTPETIINRLGGGGGCDAAATESPARLNMMRLFSPLKVTINIAPTIWNDMQTRAQVLHVLGDKAAFCRRVQEYTVNPGDAALAGCDPSRPEPIEVFLVVRTPPYQLCLMVPTENGSRAVGCKPPAPAMITQQIR